MRDLSISFLVSLSLVVLASIAATQRGLPPLNYKDDVTAVLGVNTHNLNPTPADLDLIQEAGIRWIRDDVGWGQIEKVKGVYDFSSVEYMFKSLSERNMGWICILGAHNPNYNNDTDVPLIRTQEQIDAWAKFAGAIAAKYSKTNIVLFELTNEPNGMGGFNGDEGAGIYSRLSAAGARAIHDAGGTVAGPAVANIDYDWLHTIFLNGFLDSVDYLTLHPYRSTTPETVMLDYEKVKALVNEFNPQGHSLQISQGECGYEHMGAATPGLDFETQGKFVVRMYLSAIGKGVFPAIWYDWRSGNISDPKQEHDGMVDQNLKPLPGWHGTKTLNAVLKGSQFVNMPLATVSYPSIPSTEDYALSLKNKTHSILVVWSVLSYEHNIQIHSASGCWNAMSWLGERKSTVCSPSGKNYLNVYVNDAPLYLTKPM